MFRFILAVRNLINGLSVAIYNFKRKKKDNFIDLPFQLQKTTLNQTFQLVKSIDTEISYRGFIEKLNGIQLRCFENERENSYYQDVFSNISPEDLTYIILTDDEENL